MIGFATREIFPQLKTIWLESFDDGGAYVDFLFSHLLKPENILVYFDEQNLPAAMLCIEPITVAVQHASLPAAYIYGVATLPAYRGRGLSTTLMEELHDILCKKGIVLSALVPAGNKLFDFYSRRGYETAFYIKNTQLVPADWLPEKQMRISVLPPQDFAAIRDRYFDKDSRFYVKWNRDYLEYIAAECSVLSGEILSLSSEGYSGFALCYHVKGNILIKEIAVPEELFDSAVYAIHKRYHAKAYIAYLPAYYQIPHTNKLLPFAMLKWYDREKQKLYGDFDMHAAYIAHVLD